ncbi:response regulator transcription factor [Agarivorans sp. QJM3NY_25]|uniref:response regulator transcription factor n=1 Tax=Agarivorans sp. QJM3NY_25 TaxID=3421430 RepID=UPI003D7D0C81
MSARILVIEDDHDINNLIVMNLGDLLYQVESCDHGGQGFIQASQQAFDLIVLDLMLPGMNGLDICQQLRARQINTPILMLTARDSEADRVVGLEMGADDYLTKPFSVRELQARVKAMLRRVDLLQQSQNHPEPPLMQHQDLSIDVARRQVSVAQQVVELTSTEFDLLYYLAKSPGLVFSRTQLLDEVWGYQHSGYEHTVNSHINRLRTKLESDPSHPQYVLTVWGVGYKFNDV